MDLLKDLRRLEDAVKRYEERMLLARQKYYAAADKILDKIRRRRLEEVRKKITGHG
jgi:cobalamin biosynthesis Mg chelatase CobN